MEKCIFVDRVRYTCAPHAFCISALVLKYNLYYICVYKEDNSVIEKQ